jgi:hypothetical protein
MQSNPKETKSKKSNALSVQVDYAKKENQIGCGYCSKEKSCKIRDAKINKAKEGCNEYQHWKDFEQVVEKEV